MHAMAAIGITVWIAGAPASPKPPTIGWGKSATAWRGRTGKSLRFTCPPAGNPRTVWGTGIYTDDSSICTAAVHAGHFSPGTGGTVRIEIRPGERRYRGSTQNGITSRSYAAWSGSFIVAGGAPNRPSRTSRRKLKIDWRTTATRWRGKRGQRIALVCPRSGKLHTVWGTDIYTDDSSICTAAVHAGRIGRRGGTVEIEIRPGEPRYRGTRRAGVVTRSYGRWTGSFSFVP